MVLYSLVQVITLAILYTACCSPATAIRDASYGYFSIDLIHRDSVKSPFYDPSMPYSKRIGHALQRSFINAKRVNENRGLKRPKYQTEIIPDHGEYLLNISYGNPPHQVLAIADTGSDLSWIQCEPCIKCYKHKAKLFNPKTSSTYRPIDCKSKACMELSLPETSCSLTKSCQFFESYADGSFSNGTVSRETVTLGDQVLPNMIFGCGFSNGGIFRETWGGIIGLGGGDYSLVSQINTFVPDKFSYCLIPFPKPDDSTEKSSKMIFGNIDIGPGFVSTPLVPKLPKTYYYVTLEGVSVNDERFDIRDNSSSQTSLPKGNMIVDSGTTLTMLPRNIYHEVKAAVKNAVNLRTMKDPQKSLNLCYRATKVTNVPKVTMHFDGADVELGKDNIFVTVSKHIICLAFGPTTDLAIYGNLAQMNFFVGYDLQNKMVSFKPTDCEKF
uniref:aspartic proteinase CDR1-like n=1 Tax=Erigeron canadensis TaxID=72917 RepID=UPI001CB8B4DF|nr:aspartic proteinase CDR1-like [Erigeron canadensis]